MRMISLRRLLSKLTVLALSTSPAVANADTQDVSARSTCDDDDLDAELPIDREHLDARDAAAMLGRSLAHALSEMRPLSAIHLSTTWALSGDPVRRAAIANALEWAFPLLADSVILEHLSRDPDPAVRAGVARAVWVRRAKGVDPQILERLAQDTDAEVRAIAGRAR